MEKPTCTTTITNCVIESINGSINKETKVATNYAKIVYFGGHFSCALDGSCKPLLGVMGTALIRDSIQTVTNFAKPATALIPKLLLDFKKA
ncbi:MAG: hypothetical protein WCP69_15880 [Bacteroidota bacterium]